ncbi:phytanoyl-CoA dioxygenase family protein [Actinomadura bangladeshensis]|nr:phytanoyl-CoA dioxygenase family protein [Actinomadura bangladeshensis]
MHSPATGIRPITEEHAAAYRENGWVKVPGFVDPDTAGGMLEVARRYAAGDVTTSHRDLAMWREWRFVARDDAAEPFRSLAYAPRSGHAVSRLEGHGGGIRYWNDMITCKRPSVAKNGSSATGWHQDFPNHPIDRVGGATVWIALDDVVPEQGSMSFLSGSQRAGPLGRTYSSGARTGGLDLREQYPWLSERFPVSPPLALQPGDATFHHPLTVHGAGANLTDRPRWSFIVMYVPADSVYTGATYPATDDLGLHPGAPFDHPAFPVVWEGDR